MVTLKSTVKRQSIFFIRMCSRGLQSSSRNCINHVNSWIIIDDKFYTEPMKWLENPLR